MMLQVYSLMNFQTVATEVYNDYLSVNSLILMRNDFDWLSCPCDVIT